MTVTLRSFARDRCTLLEAVASWPGGEAIGLAYTPRWCGFVVQTAGVLTPRRTWGDAFELRLFDAERELRWLQTGGGRGRAVLLGETVTAPEWTALSPVEAIATSLRHYLVWGTATEGPAPEGWSRLWDGRIGALPVPLPGVAAGACVRLRATEYLARVDAHGNVRVVEERLSGLEAAT